MEAQVIIIGLGASIKPIGLGANLATGAYITFRQNKRRVLTLGIADYLNLGGDKGTLLFGYINTDFFKLGSKLHPWTDTIDSLVGSTLDLRVSGTLLVNGTVSITLDRIDKDGNLEKLISKTNINASGAQIADTMIRGVAKELPMATAAQLEKSVP